MESDKYDIENEAIRLKRELKVFEQNIGLLKEEKEHLIHMLELKNHLLASQSFADNTPSNPSLVGRQMEIFNAMQKLSMFMLSRTSNTKEQSTFDIDETSANLIRSIFNENSTKMLEYYERKVEQ